GTLAIHPDCTDVLPEPADLDPAGRSDRKEERAGGSRGLDNDHAVLADEARPALAARNSEIDNAPGRRPPERVTLAAARLRLADPDPAAVDVPRERVAAAQALDLSDPVCGGPDETARFGVPSRLRHAGGDAVRADAGGGGDTAAERDQLQAA